MITVNYFGAYRLSHTSTNIAAKKLSIQFIHGPEELL